MVSATLFTASLLVFALFFSYQPPTLEGFVNTVFFTEQGILFLGKPYSRAQLARMLRVALREKEARHAQEPAE